MPKEHPILTKNIELLATSDEFIEMARQNNFENLREITSFSVYELIKLPGMNYRMLAELGDILNGYNLIDIIKED